MDNGILENYCCLHDQTADEGASEVEENGMGQENIKGETENITCKKLLLMYYFILVGVVLVDIADQRYIFTYYTRKFSL